MKNAHAHQPYTSAYRQYFQTISAAIKGAQTHFERHRKTGPLQVLLTMQAAHFAGSDEGGQSWEDGLASVARSLGEDTKWGRRFMVSRTAFHRAIKKVDEVRQSELWNVCQDIFPAATTSTLSDMHGIRFAHIDGTQIRTPRSAELLELIGTQTNGPNKSCHYPVAKCVVVLEAGTQRILGHELCRCKAFDQENEPVLAREERNGLQKFLDKDTENHAIIGDSGFASQRIFSDLIARKRHFMIAVPQSWNIAKKFRISKKSDSIVNMTMSDDPQRTLTLRLFTIRDSDGKSHIIATTLLDLFTLSECRRLYKTRWSIETWFRYAKQFLSLRHLRSTTQQGMRLEILAILLVLQAVAVIRAAIAHHVNNIPNLLCSIQDGFRKAKFRTALRAAWHAICLALANTHRTDDPPRAFKQLLDTLVTYMSGRKFDRVSKSPRGGFIPKRSSKSQRKALA